MRLPKAVNTSMGFLHKGMKMHAAFSTGARSKNISINADLRARPRHTDKDRSAGLLTKADFAQHTAGANGERRQKRVQRLCRQQLRRVLFDRPSATKALCWLASGPCTGPILDGVWSCGLGLKPSAILARILRCTSFDPP